jgi:hypothetical protein
MDKSYVDFLEVLDWVETSFRQLTPWNLNSNRTCISPPVPLSMRDQERLLICPLRIKEKRIDPPVV